MSRLHRRLSLLMAFVILFSLINSHVSTVKAACTLSGTVYIDFNLNGVRDVDESGVAGVVVTAYDSERPVATVLGSAITDQNGDFTLDLSQVEDVAVRVEYTDLPESLVTAPYDTVDYNAQHLSTTVLFGSCDSNVIFEQMNQILFTQDAYCTLFCEYAAIELGNRVWYDLDGNGRQDPDEEPIADVLVSLYIETETDKRLVAQTTTDSRGQYYFNAHTIEAYRNDTGRLLYVPDITFFDANANGMYDADEGEPFGVVPNSTYFIMIDNPINFLNEDDPLWGYYATKPLANPDNSDNSNIRDSDGFAKNPAESVQSSNPVSIVVKTGDLGYVDHSFDFGFVLEAPEIPTTVIPTDQPTQVPTDRPTSEPDTPLPPEATPTETESANVSPTEDVTVTAQPTDEATLSPIETQLPETAEPPESTATEQATEAPSATDEATLSPIETELPETAGPPESTATDEVTATSMPTELPPEVTEEPSITPEETATETTATPEITASLTMVPTQMPTETQIATSTEMPTEVVNTPTPTFTNVGGVRPPRTVTRVPVVTETFTPMPSLTPTMPPPTVVPITNTPMSTATEEISQQLCHVPGGNQNSQILTLPPSGMDMHLSAHQDDFIIYTQDDYDRCVNYIAGDIAQDVLQVGLSSAQIVCEGFEDSIAVDNICETIFVPVDAVLYPEN